MSRKPDVQLHPTCGYSQLGSRFKSWAHVHLGWKLDLGIWYALASVPKFSSKAAEVAGLTVD